jgi:putative addiction module CopG family antidote
LIIDIPSEYKELIDEAIRSGAYGDAGQVIRRALEVLSVEDEWLRAHRQHIDEKIGRGLEQLDRGEGNSGDETYARLQPREGSWLKEDTKPTA